MKRHVELRPLTRGHQPILMHVRDMRWRARYLDRGDDHLATEAWPAFVAWARRALEPHLRAEEQHLLPRLTRCEDAALRAALATDAEIRDNIRTIVAELPSDEHTPTLRIVADALERHVRHCEHELFPAAERVLGSDGLTGLTDAIGVREV